LRKELKVELERLKEAKHEKHSHDHHEQPPKAQSRACTLL
jgi:hypothetical protein